MHTGTNPLADADELCRLGAADLAAAYRKGSLSPVEVATRTMDRAEAENSKYNAFTMIDRKGALEAASASEKRWQTGQPLSQVDGVPTTLKDIVWVKDWTVRYGSRTTSDKPYSFDAPAVEYLRKAGAVFIGQTTTPEFGWKAVTDSKLAGVTRNPWNTDMTSGGSSGGAAVAAAIGAGVFHLGTDGGGSIRVPAAFSGIVGLKPTFSRVAAYPASAFGTVAHIGPMARSVADTTAMLKAMSGRDVRDWAQGAGVLASLDDRDVDISGARIGYWSAPPAGRVDPEIADNIASRLKQLETRGAIIEPITLPGDNLLDLFHYHWFTGAAARLAAIPEAEHADIDPGFLDIAATGGSWDAKTLVAAQVRRAEFGAAMDSLLETYDFIVSPATSIPAFEAGLEVPAGSGLSRWTEWAAFSFPINLSQQPAAVLPCGHTQAGLPIGFQIIGARGKDANVLALAARLEEVFAS